MRNAAYHRALGKRLVELRKLHGMTQAELARTLKVSQQSVFAYELGNRRVSLDLVPTLLGLFRMTADELLGLKPLQQPRVRRVTLAERRHLEALRTLTIPDKRVVLRVTEALRRRESAP